MAAQLSRNAVLSLGLLLWAIAAQAQAGPETRTLCFFSLNNSKEFELTRDFFDGVNRPGGDRVEVLEFHDPGRDANPESSFVKMIDKQQLCDGLVISGHHTGSFGGKRAKGGLNISYLEALSCDVRYRDFFQQVKGVWLQGCRTLGVGAADLDVDESQELQADYHMQRVGAELVQDGLEQSFADLSHNFSATLDQDNPLSSRYLRIFPAATVFGWTRSSPGEKAHSENSLLYHMSHMAHLSQGGPLSNPLQKTPSAVQVEMTRSMSRLLVGDDAYAALAREAWLSHGRVRESGLGFDNPDLNTYPPLLRSSDKRLVTAKTLACQLRNSPGIEDRQSVLNRILSDRDYVAYNLNLLWQVFRDSNGESPSEYRALKNRLVTSDSLMSLLNSKLKSPATGLLMKIEYYSFYKELTGNTNSAVEALILEHVRYFLLAPDLAGSQYDIRDFRESLLLSLARHGLADTAFYRQVTLQPEVPNATLYAIAWSFLKEPPPEAELLVNDIVRHPSVESDTLRVAAIWMANHGVSEQFDSLQTIVAHPEVDEATLGTVAAIIAGYHPRQSEALLRAIVVHPEAGSFALSQATLAISKHGMEVDQGLLEHILSNPVLDKRGLQNMARLLGNKRQPGNADLLKQLIHHPQVDAIALSSVAIALGEDRFAGEPALLDSIRHHPMADERTLKYVERATPRDRYWQREEAFY